MISKIGTKFKQISSFRRFKKKNKTLLKALPPNHVRDIKRNPDSLPRLGCCPRLMSILQANPAHLHRLYRCPPDFFSTVEADPFLVETLREFPDLMAMIGGAKPWPEILNLIKAVPDVSGILRKQGRLGSVLGNPERFPRLYSEFWKNPGLLSAINKIETPENGFLSAIEADPCFVEALRDYPKAMSMIGQAQSSREILRFIQSAPDILTALEKQGHLGSVLENPGRFPRLLATIRKTPALLPEIDKIARYGGGLLSAVENDPSFVQIFVDFPDLLEKVGKMGCCEEILGIIKAVPEFINVLKKHSDLLKMIDDDQALRLSLEKHPNVIKDLQEKPSLYPLWKKGVLKIKSKINIAQASVEESIGLKPFKKETFFSNHLYRLFKSKVAPSWMLGLESPELSALSKIPDGDIPRIPEFPEADKFLETYFRALYAEELEFYFAYQIAVQAALVKSGTPRGGSSSSPIGR